MKDKALHEIFRQMEKSVLPEDFNDRIMKRVYREQRRKEWRNVVLVAFTSVLLLIGAAYIFVHYFSFNFHTVFGTLLEKTGEIISSGLVFYGFILLPVLLLCWMDYRMRRHFHLRNLRPDK
ncbi:putative uncharacterized protein [Odoribacter laneus CAG:561]|nr:putative uncharacterized protein [Odoribacter laneus CAG:561]